jgi:hypothetical protein
MTYHYVTAQGSPLYHIVKEGRIYTLCELEAQRGKIISPEPPAGKKECPTCAQVLRNTTGSADPKQGIVEGQP